jgi:hypothetical protein
VALGPWLAVALALGVPEESSLAPLGPSHPAEGNRVDLVVRGPAGLRAGEPATLKLLLSDAATDAPVQGAKVSLQLFGPKAQGPIDGEARPGIRPGTYLFETHFPVAGRFAVVASVGLRGATELIGADGLEVDSIGPAASSPRSPVWPVLLGVAAALLLFAALRMRRRSAVAAALLILGAGDARAHVAFTLPPAALAGARAFLSQELQFALGIRTAPAAAEAFPAPAGSSAASRTFIGVPRSAVVERDGHKLIFVREGPERFVAREPKLGWESEGGGLPRVSVLDGIVLDEKVVVEGAAFLRNGGAETREEPRPAGGAAGQSLSR